MPAHVTQLGVYIYIQAFPLPLEGDDATIQKYTTYTAPCITNVLTNTENVTAARSKLQKQQKARNSQ